MQYIGVMTGNSLDAADIVLSDFSDNSIHDIATYTKPCPPELRERIRRLRHRVKEVGSDMRILQNDADFINIINLYTEFVAEAVNQFILASAISLSQVRAIGFHGQTLDHCPPSVSGDEKPYTLQIGNAQLLADLTGLPVVFDFRSDDIFAGGEGAPLAPIHNWHLADSLSVSAEQTIAFCNAGNTANIALINKKNKQVLGWDVGPCNHFPDMLARRFWHTDCDYDGKLGQTGKINQNIVQALYEFSAVDGRGNNFYELSPPKSSDPQWYSLPPLLSAHNLPEDILRSAEYFSAYNLVLSFRFIPENMTMPEQILLFGGGWKNPLLREDFKYILQKQSLPVVLDSHQEIFTRIFGRLKKMPQVEFSDYYGINGQYMEARIFADMAHCYFAKIPFCYPEITGCRMPVVCGICCRPGGKDKHLWSRAAKVWKEK